jgi:hypothetical protein
VYFQPSVKKLSAVLTQTQKKKMKVKFLRVMDFSTP